MDALLSILDQLIAAGGENPFNLFAYLYPRGGWLIFFGIAFWMTKMVWGDQRIGHFQTTQFKWILLAVDVPKENLQSARAVENIFSHMAGAHESRDLIEKYFDGQYQRWFSFEIVSIEGYVQFLIRTDKKLIDLTEAAIYAQYPNAEITPVEDYMGNYPHHYPDKDWDCWGVEFQHVKEYFFPIRTYIDFEHKLEKEGAFKDPMAVLMEQLTHIGKGEMAAIQIIAQPIGQKWKEKGFKYAREVMGKKDEVQESILEKVIGAPLKLLIWITEEIFGMTGGEEEKSKEDQWLAFKLTPGERTGLEAIENKCSKVGWGVKIRGIYVGRKEVFQKSKVHFGMIGYFKQFTNEGSNGIKPDYKGTGTTAHYIFKDVRKSWRKNHIFHAFKARSDWRGRLPTILNVEELATIWHFPLAYIAAPSLRKAEVKRVEAPVGLPIVETEEEAMRPKFREIVPRPLVGRPTFTTSATSEKKSENEGEYEGDGRPAVRRKAAPPPSLPFV
ncbi:MAG: hypothetical protein HW383_807 [Candidatus Magasanikbacteria bacterium]|nr:hypothetical protein [Candidatus Magasanikbacteria bacterium]